MKTIFYPTNRAGTGQDITRNSNWRTSLTTFINNLDSGLDVTAIYLDISKYFDKIWHEGFLYKCKNDFFISGSLLSWLKSYLTDRTQRVRVGDAFSTTKNDQSRCPAGLRSRTSSCCNVSLRTQTQGDQRNPALRRRHLHPRLTHDKRHWHSTGLPTSWPGQLLLLSLLFHWPHQPQKSGHFRGRTTLHSQFTHRHKYIHTYS